MSSVIPKCWLAAQPWWWEKLLQILVPDFVKDEATASSGFVASLEGCASAAVGLLENGGAATVAVGSPTEALGTAVATVFSASSKAALHWMVLVLQQKIQPTNGK